MLSCILYSVIDNYFCIDYIFCKSKTLSRISSDKIFEQARYNILLGIVIIEVLMNLVSCHEFMEKPNSTVILNCRSCMVNFYLAKCFVIMKHNSNKLSSLLNMTVEFRSYMNPWQDKRIINASGMPMPINIS